jgi:DnaJ-domain-containing protein 1
MERDDLKDFLKKTLGSSWDKFKDWNEQMDKYLEELEKKYEAAEKERSQKPWNNINSSKPNPNSQNSYSNPKPPKPTALSPEEAHYKALELPKGSDFEKIKAAYRSLVKVYHPDKFENDPEKKAYAQEVTRQINEAYFYFKKKFGA